jgi:hypothetical protein
MKVLIQNEIADILVYSHKDYSHNVVYVVCYGLDVYKTKSLQEMMIHYKHCLKHSEDCGFEDSDQCGMNTWSYCNE